MVTKTRLAGSAIMILAIGVVISAIIQEGMSFREIILVAWLILWLAIGIVGLFLITRDYNIDEVS